MFTFIRMAVMHLRGQTTDTPVEHVDHVQEDDMLHGNPWQRELDRLAHQPAGLTPTSRRPRGSYLPKPEQVQRKPLPKAGTITDLKVWWGKATSTYRPPTNVDSNFAPPPAKKRNHWSI